MRQRLAGVVVGLTAMCLGATAFAQQTAPALQAPEPGGGLVAKARTWVDGARIADRVTGDADGWYPRFASVTRGDGVTVGPGYRTHLFDDRILVDLSAGFSSRLYKAVDANVRWLRLFDERVEIWTTYRYEDLPQEDFFGTGANTTPDMRTSYTLRSSDLAVRGQASPAAWLRVGAALGYQRPQIGRGQDAAFPSIEDLFTDATAPGLDVQPDYRHASVFADADFRDVPGNPHRGGYYHVAFASWNDLTGNDYDFRRVDAFAVQHVPLDAARRHVVSGHVGLSTVASAPGDRVPFYVLPYIGGSDTVRSFREFRFKDSNALFFGAEYRWFPRTWVSIGAFADAGTVAPDWRALGRSGLKTALGGGIQFHSATQTFGRLDVGAGGGEGWRLFLGAGPAF